MLSLIIYSMSTKSFSQVISPLLSNEQCPETNITFTVTIAAKSIQSVTPKALNVAPLVVQQPFNSSVNGANITFSFVGRFADYNNKQTFTVNYTNASDVAVTFDFTYAKIKSLLTPSTFSQISPNPTTITSPPCQITNHNISFPNIQYGNPWETPPIGYGSITTYEYLLPSGWVLNGTTSNGSTWLAGSNNVTVTSNLTTGGVIQIRAVNPCGANLQKGQISNVVINRPKPSLSFSGASTICSSTTFQANGVPNWVNNTLWSVSPSSLVSISTPTSNPATFTKAGNGTGTIQFTINGGSSCPLSFNYNTQEIVNNSQIEVDAPVTTWPEVFYPTTGCLPMGFNVTYTTTSQFQPYGYEWGYYEGPSGNGSPYVLVGTGGTQQAIRITNTETINRISVKAINACGAGVPNIREFTFSTGCDGGGDVEYRVKPKEEKTELIKDKFGIVGHPANSLLTLTIPQDNLKKQIAISDLNGRILMTILNTTSTVVKVDISKLKSGLYFVTLLTNDTKQVLKFVKQ